MTTRWLSKLEDVAALVNERGPQLEPERWRDVLEMVCDEHRCVAAGRVSEAQSRDAVRRWLAATGATA